MTGIQHYFLRDPVAHDYQDRQSGQQGVFEHQPAIAHNDSFYCVKSLPIFNMDLTS
jgi:hypothetical protein